MDDVTCATQLINSPRQFDRFNGHFDIDGVINDDKAHIISFIVTEQQLKKKGIRLEY